MNVPDVKSMLSTGKRVVDERRSHAGQLRSDLVNEGRQAVDAIGGVLEESVRRIQSDLERRLHTLGFATRADLEAIEHQLARLVALRAQSGPRPAADPTYREVLRTTIAR